MTCWMLYILCFKPRVEQVMKGEEDCCYGNDDDLDEEYDLLGDDLGNGDGKKWRNQKGQP